MKNCRNPRIRSIDSYSNITHTPGLIRSHKYFQFNREKNTLRYHEIYCIIKYNILDKLSTIVNLKDHPAVKEFMFAVRSRNTQELYLKNLRYFYEFTRADTDKLLKLPLNEIQDLLKDYVIHMRNLKIAYGTIKNRVSVIITFLELNDKLVNKRKIARFYGEEKKTIKDFSYTIEDIQKMLTRASFRVKTIILLYSSTGIRKSALIDLKLKHLKKINEYDLYKITIYENTKEEYYTFCTPECASAIDSYIDQRKQAGEIINKESYLFRNEFDYFGIYGVRHPHSLTGNGLSGLIRNLLIVCGLRDDNENKFQRHEKAMFHAFRKFFDTTLINADVNQIVKELLMGHSVGLDNSYYRPNEEKMLTEYLKAVNNLTINEEFRLKKQLTILQIKQDEIDTIKSRHENELKMVKQRFSSLEDEVHKFISSFSNVDQKTTNKFARQALKNGLYVK